MIEYVKKGFLPAMGCEKGSDPSKLTKPVGLLLDAFKEHYQANVKSFMKGHDMQKWLVMDGGITPKAQPLDALVNKVFNGFFYDIF